MGYTIIEKIMAGHANPKVEQVKPGDIVWIDLDVRSARDFGGANVVDRFEKEFGPQARVDDPSRTFFTFDCVVPAKTIPYADNQHRCRGFARQQDIKVFDVNQGIGSHVMIENGLAQPGSTVVGTDSHLNIMGAVGAFGQGMGDQDIAFAFQNGRTWFEVPETIKVTLKGQPSSQGTPKDITLAVLGHLGSSHALGKAIEFYGEAVDNLSPAGRITLASMATEMGAIIALIPPNQQVMAACQASADQAVHADSDAIYCEEIEISISDLEPMVSLPGTPHKTVPLKQMAGKKIDSVFVGSCTNGRIEDFQAVYQILKDNPIAKNVVVNLVPATRKVYGELMQNGFLQLFFQRGAVISNPGCGGCASGQIGMTGQGEVQVSTSNRNFKGKQGNGETYLASPATAAWAAVKGHL